MSSMAAAEGSTWEGSAPKIQATSMHSVGRTRLPPASMEYLIASSNPPSRSSSVNLSPCRYSSKTRLCVSHRTWLCVMLAPSAMPHLTVNPQPGAPQYPAHERRSLLTGEPRGELDGLVDGDLGRDIVDVEHLVEREAQYGAVYGAHAMHRPSFGDLGEHGIEVFLLLLDPACEPDGVLI